MSTKPITDTITAPILDIVEARDCIATLNQTLEDITNLIWLIQQYSYNQHIQQSLLRAIYSHASYNEGYPLTLSGQLNNQLKDTDWYKSNYQSNSL